MTTLQKTADLAGQTYTLTCKDPLSGALVIPTSTPTATMYTDAGRTLGPVALTVTATAQPQIFTVTLPVTAASTRYLKHLIPTASGTVPDEDDDIIFSAVTGSVSGGLCTPAEVKLQLGKTTTTDDVELQSYIDAVTAPVERYCGAILPRAVVNEQHSPFTAEVALRTARVASMTSVVEYIGVTARTYTEIATPASAGTYTYLRDGVILTRLGPGGHPTPFEGRVFASYTAGFASVPADANLAARLIVQHLWRTQNGGAGLPSLSDEAVVEMPGFSYSIPNRAKELLDGLLQVGGFA